MDKIVELSVENFKTVKKADITLNGITMVSGINGCGKSSLSQLLYYSFYYANGYEELANNFLEQDLACYANVLKQIEREIKYIKLDSGDFYDIYHVSVKDNDSCLRYIKQLFSRLLSYRDIIEEVEDNGAKVSLNRLVRIIRETLQDKSQQDLDQLLDEFYNQIEISFIRALVVLEQRDYELLEDYISFCMKGPYPRNGFFVNMGFLLPEIIQVMSLYSII